jgi:hypothetical protein
MKNAICMPFGFPLGWICCRLMDGNFRFAIVDSVAVLALIGALYLVQGRSMFRS